MPEIQILIVDDEIHVAETIQKWLVSSNYAETTIETTGRAAIEKALAMEPGLILMDVRLGDEIDGIKAAEEILKRLDVPIIYMTAYLDEEIVQRAKITEPFGYLLKPFEGRDLEIAIEMALYKHKMQRKLKANYQWLAATLRSIGDGVITTDTDGNITFMNPVAEALTGWKQVEVLGKPLPQVFKIVGKEVEIDELSKTRLEDNTLLTRNGKKVSIDHSAAPIVDDYDHVTGSVLVLRDTTERKRYEEALRLSEERYRLAQRVACIGSWEWDIRTKLFYWSDQIETILGFKPGEFPGTYEAFIEAVHPEDRLGLVEAINRGLKDDSKEYEVEHRIIWPDQTIRWVLGRGRLVKDKYNHPVRFVGVVQDITNQKQAQQALAENEERYRSISELISDYAYSCYLFPNRDVEVVWITEEAFKRIYGLTYSEMLKQGGWLSFVHPEDQKRIGQGFERMLQTGQPYVNEFRVVTIEGKIKWIRDSGRAVQWRNPEQPVLVYGAAQDITKRKQAEEALQQRNNELALLNNVSQAFISTLNLDQVLTSVLDEVRNLLDVVACSAWLVDPETGGLICRQVTDPQGQIVRGWRLSPGEGIAGWVAQQGKSLLVSDTKLDARHYKQVDQKTGLEIRSILSVPLRVNQAIIGVLQAVDKTINRFTETDLALLESLAATAAIAIENARLYEQTHRDAETKATLLREVNHRVKNNLAAIIGLLYAERQYPRLKNGEAYQHFIQDLINRIHGLATAHHLLSEAQWRPLPLHSLIEQIISSALQTLPLDKYISVVVTPSQVRIGPKQANDLALVINELTTNTMKYALLDRQTARIEVNIVQDGEFIRLQFQDDGPGYPEEVLQEKRHNVGIYLIQTMVSRGLEGEATFHNDHGAVTNIRFRVTT